MNTWTWDQFLSNLEFNIEALKILQTQCDDFREGFKKLFGLTEESKRDPRLLAFAAVHNNARIGEEFLDNYYSLWSELKPNQRQPDQECIDELVPRCIEFLKSIFFSNMSVIEYSVKETIKLYPKHLLQEAIDRREKLVATFEDITSTLSQDVQQRLSPIRKKLKGLPILDTFQYILEKSCSLNMIEQQELEQWKAIVELRNSAAHNGMYAHKDIHISTDGLELKIQKGEPICADLDVFTHCSVIVVDHLCKWLQAVVKAT